MALNCLIQCSSLAFNLGINLGIVFYSFIKHINYISIYHRIRWHIPFSAPDMSGRGPGGLQPSLLLASYRHFKTYSFMKLQRVKNTLYFALFDFLARAITIDSKIRTYTTNPKLGLINLHRKANNCQDLANCTKDYTIQSTLLSSVFADYKDLSYSTRSSDFLNQTIP